MKKINDGGAAFPFAVPEKYDSVAPGMTLRDYFAGQVLAGMSATFDSDSWPYKEFYRLNVAKECYLVADAMLKAMEKANGQADG